jgi:drug/metabolite transporter (DMT)-like permease
MALRWRGLARSALADVRARPKWALVLAMTAVAAPFLLITFGEHVVPTGLTAVLISPASLFIALLAPFIMPSERIDWRQVVGMLLGLAGVALVVGVESVHSLKEFLGALAMIGAAFFYALSSFVVKARYGSAAVQTSWISVTVAGLLTLPAGSPPRPAICPASVRSPRWRVWASSAPPRRSSSSTSSSTASAPRGPGSSPISRPERRCSTARSSSTRR